MKKKVLGIVIVCTVLIGLLAVYISHRQEISNPETEATPETASSLETNADGYGEETLVQTEDGSYLDGETSDETESGTSNNTETVEQPVATMSPQVTSTPQPTPEPVQATPQPTAAPQPVATTPPQQTMPPQETSTQPEQSYDDGGVVPDWVDTSDTPLVSDEEYNAAGEILGDFEFE